MKIYLVRHGTANSPELDPEKGLSDDGKREAKSIAGQLMSHGVFVSEVWHSDKKRAIETAYIIDEAVKGGLVQKDGMRPDDDITPIASEIDELEESTMLVGHLPFMNRLASFLLCRDADADMFKFPAASVLALVKGEDGKWRELWQLIP